MRPLLRPIVRYTCNCIRSCSVLNPLEKSKQNVRPRIVRLIVMQILSDVDGANSIEAVLQAGDEEEPIKRVERGHAQCS